MRHTTFWWLVRLVFVFFIVFNAILLYQYWSLTGKKLTVENPVVSPSPATKNSAQLSGDIEVLENYPVPTVYAMGTLVDYQFRQNSQTNGTELYVALSTQEGVLPIRIDKITISGRKPVYLFVDDFGEKERWQIIEILDHGKAGAPIVDSTYVILSSVNSQDQVAVCQNVDPDAGNGWCLYDPTQKSYSTDDLLMQTKKYLNTNSGYLHLGGNVSQTLQINYHYEQQ